MKHVVKLRVTGGTTVLTIPKALQQALGWTPGDYIALTDRAIKERQGTEIVHRPVEILARRAFGATARPIRRRERTRS